MSAIYDVGVVGAGPAGATTAYYLAQRGLSVLLLDRARFPRDKLCGDSVCSLAHKHLSRMGVLEALIAEGNARAAGNGGFVSPAGIEAIADSSVAMGRPLVYTIKRYVLDERIVRAAVAAGAELQEEVRVVSVERSGSVWTLRAGSQRSFRARALVAADGAGSQIARSLGLVETKPDAVCSRAYIRGAALPYDGMVIYPEELLPGYCGLVRFGDGDINFCCYVIPGGSARNDQIRALHDRFLGEPRLKAWLGPDAEIGEMKGAGLRLGGVAKSYADGLLLVGDAAGQIDPLTGEGIQFAMEGAEIAADTLAAALAAGNVGGARLARYHERWMRAFGDDFAWSRRLSLLCARAPFLLDASAEAARRHGIEFFLDWAKIMTGDAPKRELLRPSLAATMAWELGRQLWRRAA